mgnify:FL=1
MLATKANAYFVRLPRWFGTPAAVLAVLLGGFIAGADPLPLSLAAVASTFMMAYAHSWNTFHDWVTGFDQGPVEQRSHEKPYTLGQNLVAKGGVSHREALYVALAYLAISAGLTGAVSALAGPWIWLPWGLVAMCAPLYSWGKLHYLCELFLGLGFGPLAVVFGAAVSEAPNWGQAFAVGIPLGLIFGYMAETVDQWWDADVNVPKGLRNIGALTWRLHLPLVVTMCFISMTIMISHIALAVADLLTPWSLLAFISPVGIFFLTPWFERRNTRGIMLGLLLVLCYPLIIVLAEVLS